MIVALKVLTVIMMYLGMCFINAFIFIRAGEIVKSEIDGTFVVMYLAWPVFLPLLLLLLLLGFVTKVMEKMCEDVGGGEE